MLFSEYYGFVYFIHNRHQVGFIQSQNLAMFCGHIFREIGVLKNFVKFAGRHLCWRLFLFLTKLQA